ncbi:IMP dehydrogenase [Candidatus Woesearchaeota archaeon]|nr:IMP dehydrogenase [Candidatus Woesearchaeota archaeon]
MAEISDKVSRTLGEYMFTTEHTPKGLTQEQIDLAAILTREVYEEGRLPYRDEPKQKGMRLKIPVMSAAMQCVTGSRMGTALAQLGGIGVIYCSQTIEEEARMAKAVKRAKAGFVSELEVVNGEVDMKRVVELIETTGYNTIPVVAGNRDNYGKFLGIIDGPIPSDIPLGMKSRDFMRAFQHEPLESIVERMLPDRAVGRGEKRGMAAEIVAQVKSYIPFAEADLSLEEVNAVLKDDPNLKYMPIINKDSTLKYLVFRKDLKAHLDFPYAVVDQNKRYIIGAAVNTHDHSDRVPALVEAGADVIFIDASDGWSRWQEACIDFIKGRYPDMPVIAGNIVRGDAFDCLAEHGIDGIKVGMGSGSICITSEEKGTGRGLATALKEVTDRRDAYFRKTGVYIPIIADGGISLAKDLAIALCIGADSVMMGGYFAPCDESSAPRIQVEERTLVEYYGEGHSRAKAWCRFRYGQTDFDEGVIKRLPLAGPVADKLAKTFARVRSTMITEGAHNIGELRNAEIELISDASRIQAGAQ